jgi:hypothetical protein
MPTILRFLTLAILTNINYAVATTLPALPIAELFREADLVVVATVTKGELIGLGELTCGAKYSAQVEESFKGSRKGATIEFGNYYGYELGGRYVLFLTKAGRNYDPMMTTNSMHLRAQDEFRTRCGSKLDRNTVMHSGFGALRIQYTNKFNFTDGVRVPTKYLVLPKGTNTAPAIASESEEFSDVVWVKLEQMLLILRDLASGR